MTAFLGVETSLTGRRWSGPDPHIRRAAQMLRQITGLSVPLCTVLARIGIAPENVPSYLEPSLRDLLPDPRTLKDMKLAAERFCEAVDRRQRIAIFADYDVDGGASAALLIWWLRDLKLPATLYVPDRIAEGYGPNAPAMDALAQDHDLILCVDCGTLSHEALAAAETAQVIVLDHHLGGETLPPALAIVNPNRQDETGELGHLCAAAVVFLFLVEVGRHRRTAGLASPDLLAFLDLVALATIADAAPLYGVNRAVVRQGLKVMARRDRPGLTALADIAQLNCAPSAHHLGFVFGPRINAGGRIGQADLGARLLACDQISEASSLAERLELLNTERREIELQVRQEALAQIETRPPSALAWAAGQAWHPGVVGITAARLKEATGSPAVVIGFEGDAGKGSARSVSGVDLGAAIQRLTREGLIERGGGHKMAAGISLHRSQLAPAMERLEALITPEFTARGAAANTLHMDGQLSVAAVNGADGIELIEALDLAGPFGTDAPAPRFAFADVRVTSAREVGQGHLKLTLADGGPGRLEAIAFGAFETALGPKLSTLESGLFHLAGRLEANTFRGRTTAQLRIEDAHFLG